MKTLFLAGVMLALSAIPASAQAKWWQTSGECQVAAASPAGAIAYEPPKKACALKPEEEVAGHPTGGCFQMEVAEAGKGLVWVWRNPGYPMVHNKKTDIWTKDSKCCNDVTGFQPPLRPTPVSTPIRDAVVNTKVEGGLKVEHQGTVTVKHEGTVILQPAATSGKKSMFSWLKPKSKKGKVILGIGTAAVAYGTYEGVRRLGGSKQVTNVRVTVY